MKAKTFENLIRKIVREEIDYALRREIKSLKEDLRSENKPIVNERQNSSLKETIMGTPKTKKRKKINFGVSNTLNDLLNETAQGDTNTETIAPASMARPFATGAPLSEDTAGMPESVAKAVTRDYSGLMKAINKKKGI